VALFEAFYNYCFVPKHTIGTQLLTVRRDKQEREAFAACRAENIRLAAEAGGGLNGLSLTGRAQNTLERSCRLRILQGSANEVSAKSATPLAPKLCLLKSYLYH
jgi:hypothetical protein